MIIEELIAILGFDIKGNEKLGKFAKSLDDTAKSAEALATRVGNAAAVMGAALTAGLGFLAKSVIDTGAQFETLEVQLEALEGSAEKGKQALEWIREFAGATPLSLSETSRAFVQLRNFGIDPTNGSLLAAVDSAAMMGKGIEHVMGITLAMGQAWSKGKLQGNDILQLIDRGIPVWALLSEVMGKSVEEVQELSAKGKIGRVEMQKFFDAMGKRASGASEKMSKTWAGIMGRMGDIWEDFNKRIADAGVFESSKKRLETLLELFQRWQKDGTMDKVAKKVSDTMEKISDAVGVVVDRVGHHIKVLNDSWDSLSGYITGVSIAIGLLIARAFPLVTALFILALAVEDLATYLQGGESVIGSFIEKLKELTGLPEELAAALTAQMAIVGTTLTVGLSRLAPKIIGAFVGAALRVITGPVGIALLIAEIIAAFFGVDLFNAGVNMINNLINGVRSAIPSLQDVIRGIADMFNLRGKTATSTGGAMSPEMANAYANFDRLTSSGVPAIGQQNNSNSVTVNTGPITVQSNQNPSAAVGAAVGAAIGNGAASGASNALPSRIVNPGSAF